MTTNQPWYPIATMRRDKARVRVQWAGRLIEVVRLRHRGNTPRWVTLDANGETRELPPRREVTKWGHEPDAWQPIDPATWPDDLGEPLAAPRPGMANINPPRQRGKPQSLERRALGMAGISRLSGEHRG